MPSVKILITGPGGSGKTTLARYFASRGVNGIDADLAGIGMWLDVEGRKMKTPEDLDFRKINKWAEENILKWHWDESRLRSLLSQPEDVYLMGSAYNAFDLSGLFDRVYYLEADENLIERRLMERTENGTNYHDNGSTDEQRKEILLKVPIKREEARRRNFEFIDASLPPKKIFGILTGME